MRERLLVNLLICFRDLGCALCAFAQWMVGGLWSTMDTLMNEYVYFSLSAVFVLRFYD